MDHKLFLRRLFFVEWWEEEILLNVSVAHQVLLFLWWSVAKVADAMLLEDDGLEIVVRCHHDLEMTATVWQVDANELDFIIWIHGANPVVADFGEREEALWHFHGRSVVKRAVNCIFTIHDNRSLHWHLSVFCARRWFDSLHHFNCFLEFWHLWTWAAESFKCSRLNEMMKLTYFKLVSKINFYWTVSRFFRYNSSWHKIIWSAVHKSISQLISLKPDFLEQLR